MLPLRAAADAATAAAPATAAAEAAAAVPAAAAWGETFAPLTPLPPAVLLLPLPLTLDEDAMPEARPKVLALLPATTLAEAAE